MAASDSAFDLLATDPSLKWLASERILLDWRDDAVAHRRQLGAISTTNRASNITFSIGHDSNINTLLIAFHFYLKLRPSTSSKPKHMFFVVPAETLESHSGEDALAFDVCNVSDISEPTLSELGDAGLVDSPSTSAQRIIRLRFRLKKPGYVIMPQASVGRDITGTPLQLLQNLQSLSQATSFDAYLRFNTYAQVGLDHATRMLRQGLTTTPKIDIESMFKGLGAINVWDQYGLADDTRALTPSSAHEHQTRASPPPYPNVRTFGPSPAHSPKSLLRSPSAPAQLPIESSSSPNPHVLVPCSETGSPPVTRLPAYDASRRRNGSVISETPVPEQPSKRRRLNESVADDDGDDDDTTIRLTVEICEWLQWAWTWQPSAHEHLREHLLTLGRAARDGDVPSYSKIRAECSTRLMWWVAEHEEDVTAAADEQDLKADVEGVVRFILSVHFGADILLDTDIMQMVRAALGKSEGRSFEQSKALCIAKACVQLQ